MVLGLLFAFANLPAFAGSSGPHIHHIATDKNCVSVVRGGPWTPRFEQVFKLGGMSLDDAANKVKLAGHQGPHSEAYHQEVFNRLNAATRSLKGQTKISAAIRAQLKAMKKELLTKNSKLYKLLFT
jgi:hypothetical protein